MGWKCHKVVLYLCPFHLHFRDVRGPTHAPTLVYCKDDAATIRFIRHAGVWFVFHLILVYGRSRGDWCKFRIQLFSSDTCSGLLQDKIYRGFSGNLSFLQDKITVSESAEFTSPLLHHFRYVGCSRSWLADALTERRGKRVIDVVILVLELPWVSSCLLSCCSTWDMWESTALHCLQCTGSPVTTGKEFIKVSILQLFQQWVKRRSTSIWYAWLIRNIPAHNIIGVGER